jgi:hypothetical protein
MSSSAPLPQSLVVVGVDGGDWGLGIGSPECQRLTISSLGQRPHPVQISLLSRTFPQRTMAPRWTSSRFFALFRPSESRLGYQVIQLASLSAASPISAVGSLDIRVIIVRTSGTRILRTTCSCSYKYYQQSAYIHTYIHTSTYTRTGSCTYGLYTAFQTLFLLMPDEVQPRGVLAPKSTVRTADGRWLAHREESGASHAALSICRLVVDPILTLAIPRAARPGA